MRRIDGRQGPAWNQMQAARADKVLQVLFACYRVTGRK